MANCVDPDQTACPKQSDQDQLSLLRHFCPNTQKLYNEFNWANKEKEQNYFAYLPRKSANYPSSVCI